MYSNWFRIKENIWNNSFSYDIRKQKNSEPKIYVTDIIEWTIGDIQIWDNIVFEEIDSKWEIKSFFGLKNFVKLIQDKPIYILDNHNHALFFRYQELFNWNISKWIKLIHIDQHTDMNDNLECIINNSELDEIFNFTNYQCNVWNFIKPAIQDWLISKINQINTEYILLQYWYIKSLEHWNYILDIDLDFRHPQMWIEDYKKTIEIIKDLISQASLVTIATSPYFMDQKLAIKILKDIFY
jgi:hypothetical protein